MGRCIRIIEVLGAAPRSLDVIPERGIEMKWTNGELLIIAVKAQLLMRNLGLKCAAGFLRNRGVSPEAAVEILLRRVVC